MSKMEEDCTLKTWVGLIILPVQMEMKSFLLLLIAFLKFGTKMKSGIFHEFYVWLIHRCDYVTNVSQCDWNSKN